MVKKPSKQNYNVMDNRAEKIQECHSSRAWESYSIAPSEIEELRRSKSFMANPLAALAEAGASNKEIVTILKRLSGPDPKPKPNLDQYIIGDYYDVSPEMDPAMVTRDDRPSWVV